MSSSLDAADRHSICCHYLNPSMIDVEIQESRGHAALLDLNIHESLALHRYIPMLPKDRRLKIITSMRDPVARNLSAFYENIHRFGGPDAPFEQRLQTFLNNYPHTVPLEWWDFELKEMLGFDLFAHKFDWEAGYTVYESEEADIFVMRADLPLEKQGQAVGAFLGIPNFVVTPDNLMSDELDRAASYTEFKERMVLPRAYVDFLYNAPASRFFWSPAQLDKMRAKWRMDDTPWENRRWYLAELKTRFPQQKIRARAIGIGAAPGQTSR